MAELTATVAIVVLVLAVHTVFSIYLYRMLTDSAADRTLNLNRLGDQNASGDVDSQHDIEDAAISAAGSSSGETVFCPTCGVENATEFQFCRRCVADLSKGYPQGDGHGSANLDG